MTWRELADFLGNQARKISLESKSDISKTLALSPSELLVFQAKTKKSVDAAIVSFCGERKWPKLDQESSSMLVRRMLFAETLLRGFALLKNKDRKPLIPCEPDLTDAELVECLLIDAWERYGLLESQLRS